jgi:hypothetical protein
LDFAKIQISITCYSTLTYYYEDEVKDEKRKEEDNRMHEGGGLETRKQDEV